MSVQIFRQMWCYPYFQTDEYVIYYNSGLKSLLLFRLSDATQLANYVIQAELKSINTSYDGRRVMFGSSDGALTTLIISDPRRKEDYEQIRNMKSRQTKNINVSMD